MGAGRRPAERRGWHRAGHYVIFRTIPQLGLIINTKLTMKANFERAANYFVYRRPIGSLPELRDIDSRIGFNPDYEKCILDYFKNNPGLDALMLASPSLYQEYVALKDNGHAYSEKKRNSVLASL